ncbi:MAG: IS1634 family transposase, partial [Deltaproteobacteria bacterium]|nr:IS1634 family transposase [Deltaproteobacteria bacterium]
EMGYNRDKEYLPQLNLGMYYGISSHLPVYYCLYNGSITDKTDLISMMTEAKDLGIENVRFVMDRGFVTDDNFKYMQDNGYIFITALPGGRLDAASLIDSVKPNIRKAANRIDEYEVYGVCVATKIYDLDINAHIYYDPEKQVADEKELYSRIGRLRTDLEKLSKKNKRATRKYTDFFKVSENKANTMSFEPDNDKIDERLSRAGFFILLSNEQGANSSWVLGTYRNRDVIEKSFDQFKNRLDFKRMRTHWDRTTEGKMFVGFLSLILRSYMMHMVKRDSTVKHLTIEKVLMELKKIRTVTLSNLTRHLLPITKIQRLILAGLGLSSDKMLDSFI